MKHLIILSLALTAGLFLHATHPTAGRPETVHPLPGPVTDADYHESGSPSKEKVALGRFLFFDKILSGNKNISCATCHHPRHGTSDGLALPLGEGPRGVGPDRRAGDTLEESVHERVPRNSPALFNLGAREFTRMFHDGRVEVDPDGFYESGFITPAKWKLPPGLDNVLAAQAMFPVTSPTEMAGQQGENAIADAAALRNAAGRDGVWELLEKRLREIPEYVRLFKAAFPDEVRGPGDVSFVRAANAIAAFEAVGFRADQSPFDRYLRGENGALNEEELWGANLFYGKARCADCHSGKFQTDHDFHAIAMPQIGPGKGHGQDGSYWRESGHQGFLEDHGRGQVTVRPRDDYKFRTPSLRNVAMTGPWGHAGAFDDLEDVVRHHLDPTASLEEYVPRGALHPPLFRLVELTAQGSSLRSDWMADSRLEGHLLRDSWVQGQGHLRNKIAAANELQGVALSDHEVSALVRFLQSLTDPHSEERDSLIPDRVPSGLAVAD